MQINQQFLTPNKYSRPQTKLIKPTKVIWHYTGNPKSTAINNRNYFNNAPQHKTYVSSHYIVGLQGEIIQCIPENEWAYCSNQANSYSISIETCHPDTTGKFSEITEKALIELTADICKRHNLDPLKDILRHFDITGKQCPRWYVTHPEDYIKAKERVKAMLEPIDDYCHIVVYNFKNRADGQAAKAKIDGLGFYNEIKGGKYHG